MSGCCASVYSTGIMPSGDPLSHPGGSALTRRALEIACLPAGAGVLDIGCGSGESMRLLASLGYRPLGVDPAANGCLDFPHIRAEAEALPLPSASFEAVLLECSLSIMRTPRQAIRECARVLVPGGRLIVADLYARAPEAIRQVRALAHSCVAGMVVDEELELLLRDAGFRVDLWEDHSPALRTFVASYLMRGGTHDELWGCSGGSAEVIAQAMRSVRAGYFLLLATREPQSGGKQ